MNEIRGRIDLWVNLVKGSEHTPSLRSVVWLWVATRLALGIIHCFARRTYNYDVHYYAESLQGPDGALSTALQEYPVLTAALLKSMWTIGQGSVLALEVQLYCLILFLDALFFLVLIRSDRTLHGAGYWCLALPLMGPVQYSRFDLIPATLVGLSLLAIVRTGATGGSLLGIAVATKLWPVCVAPIALLYARKPLKYLAGLIGSLLSLGALSVAVGGYSRLVSPLHFQADRGVEVESVAATPAMLLRLWRPREITEGHNSYEFSDADTAGIAALLLTVAVTGAFILCCRAILATRSPDPSRASGILKPEAIASALAVAILLLMLASGKVLSPQYLVWPLPAMSVAVSAFPLGAPITKRLRSVGVSVMVLAILTNLEFPLAFHLFLEQRYFAVLLASTLVLVVRNLLLLAVATRMVSLAWLVAGSGRGSKQVSGDPVGMSRGV